VNPLNPLTLTILPAVILYKGLSWIFSKPSRQLSGLSISKGVFSSSVQMKNEQSLIIEKQIALGNLTVEVPYDNDTLNKLIAISILPELIFVGAEIGDGKRLGRTITVASAVWDLIVREDARYTEFMTTFGAGFKTKATGHMSWLNSIRGGSTSQSNAFMQKLNALAITLDYMEAEKAIQYQADGEAVWGIVDSKYKWQEVNRTTDQINNLMNTLDTSGKAPIMGEQLINMQSQNMELYQFGTKSKVLKTYEPFFFISRVSEAWGDDNIDFEGFSTGAGFSQELSMEQLYINTNIDDIVMVDGIATYPTNTFGGKLHYDVVGWIDDKWEIIAQIPYEDLVETQTREGGAVFTTKPKIMTTGIIADEVETSLLQFLTSKGDYFEGVSSTELTSLKLKPTAGKIYNTKSGWLFATKTVAGRLLWVDTAILLGSGVLSLVIPQVKPYSPIGEVITHAWDFVAKALDYSTDELIEAAVDADLSGGWLVLIQKLVQLDKIKIDFEPNFTTISKDMNLDGRTVGVMLTKMVGDSFMLQQRDYSITKILQSLCITTLIAATLLYGWRYLRN
jgi:hypothetical protein